MLNTCPFWVRFMVMMTMIMMIMMMIMLVIIIISMIAFSLLYFVWMIQSLVATVGNKDISESIDHHCQNNWYDQLHPRTLTWNLKRIVSKRNLLFQGSIFRFHVSFRWSKFIQIYFIEIFDSRRSSPLLCAPKFGEDSPILPTCY